MKIYLAAITHKNGLNLLAGGSKEELLWKLAGYCKAQPLTDWCGETVPSREEIDAMSDEQVVETYFTGHPSEFVDEDSDDIKAPGPIPHLMVVGEGATHVH